MKHLLVLAAAAVLATGCDRGEMSGSYSTSKQSETEKAKDPVCAMFVDKAVAKDHTYKGTKYWFCSQECHDKFEKDPNTYSDGNE